MKNIKGNLFYNDKTQNYYYNGLENCFICDSKIIGAGILATFWNKKESSILFYCSNCFSNIKFKATITEYKIVIFEEPPIKSIFVCMKPPTLGDGRVKTVFEASKINTNNTKDKTKYSKTQSWKGATIGQKIEEPKLITSDEIDKYIMDYSTGELIEFNIDGSIKTIIKR